MLSLWTGCSIFTPAKLVLFVATMNKSGHVASYTILHTLHGTAEEAWEVLYHSGVNVCPMRPKEAQQG